MDKCISLSELKNHVFDGMSIMVGGFMAVGTPELLIDELVKLNIKDMTIICNDAGFMDKGVGKLIHNNQVKTLIASHIGLNPEAGQKMSDHTLDVTLVPQGTLAEQIRAGGAGLGGILTPTGLDTVVQEGKQVLTVNEKRYVVEEALRADLALVLAHKTDALGNVVYSKTTRNFNPLMATATDTVIVQSRNMVDELDPEHIITPHIFVDYIVKEEEYE